MKQTMIKVNRAMGFKSLLVIFMLIIVTPVMAQELTIRFPVEYAADVTPATPNKEFAKLIAERSNNRIRVQYFPAGSLYKGQDLLQALLRGDADMTTLVSVYWVAVSPKIAVLELPYSLPTHEAFYKVASNQDFIQDLYSEVEKKGGKVLGLLAYDYLPIGSRNRALIKPADLKGLKIRALGRTNAATLAAFGGTPVSINIVEVMGALQQGVVDGINTPADAYVSYKFYEFVRFITYAKYFFGYYPWMVNTKWWNSIDSRDQKLISDTVQEVAIKHRQRARIAAEESIAYLKNQGVAIHYQTEAEAKEWAALGERVWIDAEKAYGKPILDKLRGITGTSR